MVDVFVTLQPGQWRAVPLPDGLGECPDEDAPLEVQLVRHKLRVVLDERDRPTGEVAAEGWWPLRGEPAPQLVHLIILASALPDEIVAGLPGGGGR